jgi:RNA polymerase sigma factor (sigma-70 family)
MSARNLNCLMRHVRRTALLGLADQDLLEAFVGRQEETAFEALLKRHGPMVLAVCRRVLGNVHDAEDAFQAVFLVLVRKAASIRRREVIGSWLYGVAYRTAQKAKAMNARRRIKERKAVARPRPGPGDDTPDLDKELNALPEKYRVPVVLCELEGRPRREVARLLGIAEGTLSSRLATARKMLAKRLRRHGSFLTGAVPGTVPAGLLASTLKAAGWVAAGSHAAGVISAPVLALTEGVVKAMFVSKLKVLVAVLIVGGTLGIGTGRLTYSALAQETTAQPRPGASRTDGETLQSATDPRKPAHDLEAAKAALDQAQANLKRMEAELQNRQADLAAKQSAFERAMLEQQDRQRLLAHRAAQDRSPTPQERLSQLERKLVDVLHEVQALRNQMDAGQQGQTRGNYAGPRPK